MKRESHDQRIALFIDFVVLKKQGAHEVGVDSYVRIIGKPAHDRADDGARRRGRRGSSATGAHSR